MNKFKIDTQINDTWYILQGEEQKGPYNYEEMIFKLQNLEVFEFNYVWGPHLESWTPICELQDFSFDRQQRLIEKNENHEAFKKRRHKRVFFNRQILIHDNDELWKGNTLTLSEGGASLIAKTPLLVPGNIVVLHFINKTEPISVQAEVIAKKMTKQKIKHNTEIQYSVRFLDLNQVNQQQLKKWIND